MDAEGQVFDQLSRLMCQRYEAAIAVHGDLQLDPVRFEARVRLTVERYVESGGSLEGAVQFAGGLHTSDLFLACACAQGIEAGWQRFGLLYRRYLADLGRTIAGNAFDTEEMGETIWIDLFLPDKSGHSRIASYDGRSSLATWLRVVVSNRIINERQRKEFKSGNLDGIPEPADPYALRNVEDRLGRDRYQPMIVDTFKRSFAQLTTRERLIILLRYDQGLQLGEIAQLFGVHQSTITRQLDRTVERLRSVVVALLESEYGLGYAAIEECLGVARDTFASSVSILGLIEDAAAAELSRRPDSSAHGPAR